MLVKQVKGENILGEILVTYITKDYSPAHTNGLKRNSVVEETKDRNRCFQEDTCKEQINRSADVFNSRMYTNCNDTIFA